MKKVFIATVFIFFGVEALFPKEINLEKHPSFYNSIGLKAGQDFNISNYKPEFSYSRSQQLEAVCRYKKMIRLFMQTKDKKECVWSYYFYDDSHIFELRCKNREIDNEFAFNQKNLNVKNIDTKKLKSSIKIRELNLCSNLPSCYTHMEFIESICLQIKGTSNNR